MYLGRSVLVEGHHEPVGLPPGGRAVALQQELLDELGEAGGVGRGPGGQTEGQLLDQAHAKGGVAGVEGLD